MPESLPECYIVQPIHAEGVARLRDGGVAVRFATAADMGTVAAEIGGAQAVITRDAGLTRAAIDAAPALRIISNHGIGTNKVDVVHAHALGIAVANTPSANARSVAEHAVMMMLALARRATEADAAVRSGDWAFRYSGGMTEIGGKVLGLVGFGTIAQMTAAIARDGFGMRLIVWSPNAPDATLAACGAERAATLVDLLGQADVVSLHRPMRPDTHHTIDAAALIAMKPGAFLVNTARGGLIDDAALAAALIERRIAGAGLDVFDPEPPEAANPLLGLSNILLAPHVAGATEDALRATALICADHVLAALAGREPPHMLDATVWARRRGAVTAS